MIVAQDYSSTEVGMNISEALGVIKALTDAIESARRGNPSSFMNAAVSETYTRVEGQRIGKSTPGVITFRVRESQ
jgi:hypothetical protein